MNEPFLRKPSVVDAVQFDGTAQGAAAIAKLLPDLVGHAIDAPLCLVVVSGSRLQRVPAGSWIVSHWRAGVLEVWDDAHFQAEHEPMRRPDVVALPAPENLA